MSKFEPAKVSPPGYGKKLVSKRQNFVLWAFCFLLAGFLLGQAAGTGLTAAPGSEDDPLVTMSWVKSAISQALQKEQNEQPLLEKRLQKLEGEMEQFFLAKSAPVFELVNAAAGKTLFTGAGTEIILRSGRAKVLAGPGGGLADLTAGSNLSAGHQVISDHLLLSARDDGRGLVLESQVIFLVRGGYKIE